MSECMRVCVSFDRCSCHTFLNPRPMGRSLVALCLTPHSALRCLLISLLLCCSSTSTAPQKSASHAQQRFVPTHAFNCNGVFDLCVESIIGDHLLRLAF